MGFGLLFFGYFFTLSLPFKGIDVLPDIVGCILMYFALKKLIEYCPDNRNFRYARITLIPYSVFAVIVFGWQISGLFVEFSKNAVQWFFTPISALYGIVIGVFHIFLLFGIYRLSESVGLIKPAARARRLITLTVVYYIFQLMSYSGVLKFISGLTDSPDVVLSYINISLYIIGLLWLVLTWALIFTCYMRICLEGDENMPHEDDAIDKLLSRFKNDKK